MQDDHTDKSIISFTIYNSEQTPLFIGIEPWGAGWTVKPRGRVIVRCHIDSWEADLFTMTIPEVKGEGGRVVQYWLEASGMEVIEDGRVVLRYNWEGLPGIHE